MEIRRFIGAQASDDELRQCYEVYLAEGQENYPGFPEMTFDSFAVNLRRPGHVDAGPQHIWTAWDGDRLLGYCVAIYPEQMAQWVHVRVRVREGDRRRGTGTALLRAIVADAVAEGRTTLANEQVRIGGAGARWAASVGFTIVQRRHWQMLHVAEVDRALWGVPMPAGFRLAQWIDAAPDELVAAFADARNAIADAPHGESAYRDPQWTVETVRRAEANLRAAGEESRQVVAVHEETGAIAALTVMNLEPGRVELCWQRDTAVVSAYRGLGLGRVVKAAMMRWLVADIPDLGKVVTTTAAENSYMIRVNEQVGYGHYGDYGTLEASVEQIGAALGMSSANDIPGPRRQTEQELEGA